MQFRSFDTRIRWAVLAPFLVTVALLAALAAASIDILSGARAFVGAEGQWSKAQHSAVYELQRYTQWRREDDYQRFLDAMHVLQSSRQAHLEMDRPDADLRLAGAALVQGNNHADDVDSMIRLYRRFSERPLMAEGVATWAAADGLVDELGVVAGEIRRRVLAGERDTPELQSLSDRVDILHDRLTVLNQHFSLLAGQAARTAERSVRWGMFLAGLLITLAGVGVSWTLMRREARTARALRESNERWTLATAAAGIGVFDWDLRRDRLTIDARTAALCGLPAEDVTLEGRRLADSHVHADDAPELRRVLRGAIEQPAPVQLRCRVGPDPERMRHLQLSARTRARGESTRLIGIVSDVSDDVQSQQLRLDKESAERANRAKSSFLSRMSHELRTPLNAVLGFGQLLQTDPAEPLTPNQAQRMQHVLDAARHLLALINDLLDITGLEQDEVYLQRAAVPLDEVIAFALSQAKAAAQTVQVELGQRHSRDSEGLSVEGDAMRLRQVFGHVLANAVKYNHPGGRVDVVVQRDGAHAVVEVQDTGRGLGADQLERLFQPFDRLGAENTAVAGAGLGLVITQQLVQRMGGTLTLSSTPGVGTRVELRLKLWAMAPTTAPAIGARRPERSGWDDDAPSPAGAL